MTTTFYPSFWEMESVEPGTLLNALMTATTSSLDLSIPGYRREMSTHACFTQLAKGCGLNERISTYLETHPAAVFGLVMTLGESTKDWFKTLYRKVQTGQSAPCQLFVCYRYAYDVLGATLRILEAKQGMDVSHIRNLEPLYVYLARIVGDGETATRYFVAFLRLVLTNQGPWNIIQERERDPPTLSPKRRRLMPVCT